MHFSTRFTAAAAHSSSTQQQQAAAAHSSSEQQQAAASSSRQQQAAASSSRKQQQQQQAAAPSRALEQRAFQTSSTTATSHTSVAGPERLRQNHVQSQVGRATRGAALGVRNAASPSCLLALTGAGGLVGPRIQLEQTYESSKKKKEKKEKKENKKKHDGSITTQVSLT